MSSWFPLLVRPPRVASQPRRCLVLPYSRSTWCTAAIAIDPFQASGPDIADCEDPGAARFEQMGSAGERPARGGQVLRQQVRSRLDEPLVIECDAPVQPVPAGHRARHGEHVPDALRLDLPALVVAPGHALEVTVPLEAHDLRMRVADDGWMVLDAPDQIARHGIG